MGAGSVQAFRPIQTVAVVANATTAQSASIAAGESILVYNVTTDIAFVALGGPGTVADFTGVPIPPNGQMLFETGPYVTVISAISNSVDTGTIFFTTGNGTQY